MVDSFAISGLPSNGSRDLADYPVRDWFLVHLQPDKTKTVRIDFPFKNRPPLSGENGNAPILSLFRKASFNLLVITFWQC